MSESKSSELVSSAPVDEERDAKFDIVDEVGRHFLQSDSSRLIDEWIEKHCSSFDQQTEEHSLEHTTLHEEFKTLYEDIVESKTQRMYFSSLFYEFSLDLYIMLLRLYYCQGVNFSRVL